ncbi:TraB/GumN family protein [Chitinophaga horti]|uniref:TraB/GumN family protein n=1 Tax=Chitinophaga horti TaxID=2920382 RepID=A0ABY6IW92_9BACT|nr:TraB/GumN family protein [Chitinophaga horti]UYQ91513.1 TraB/GumN family protein [Chitinophaga horti]
MMNLRSSLTVLFCCLHCVVCSAQSKAKPTSAPSPKYQGLLWEISGNGLKKPSYLFGTMHVSSKLAFNLSDSFYYCIRNADIVALETNPEELQEDFSKSTRLKAGVAGMFGRMQPGTPDKYAFTISGYGDAIRAAFGYKPEMINHLLYRSYASREDYEEDTFLDMYIYQVGKRYGKRATGVENFQESEKLMMEAYRDAAKERRTKKNVTRSNEVNDGMASLTDAYRRGDLDMLDSLANNTNDSPAFLEKFMYRRNEIMVHSIDSISHKESIFAGVGAAHLPGDRGVINLLRKKGYKVRPIAVTGRDHEQKDQVEKMTAPVVFQSYTSDDKLIQLDIPGKLYNFTGISLLNQLQYADLANGAYYLVSRVKTNALALGHKEEDVLKKVDSLLYENIPGKIISKETIQNNGYTGYNIVNRTRRGDLQRYQLFVTPFEVLVFKISGNKDYVDGEEAKRFFSSIKLTPLPATNWSGYTNPAALFSIQFPHTPHAGDNTPRRSIAKRSEYEAFDKQTGNSYMVTLRNARNTANLEEDTTDISFAEESLQLSDFVKQQVSRKFITYRGYPCLEVINQNNDQTYTRTRIVLQGIHYYVLSARYKKDKSQTDRFFDSFIPGQPQYTTYQQHQDTTLYFHVKTAVKSEDDDLSELIGMEMEDNGNNEFTGYRRMTKAFTSDSTGEEVIVTLRRFGKYYSVKDSAAYWNTLADEFSNDGDMVITQRKHERLPGWESLLLTMRDTNSSRMILKKAILKNSAIYTITALTDTLTGASGFIRTFFDTFAPADTTFGQSIYTSKASLLFKDFYSTDSTTRKHARNLYGSVIYENKHADTLMAMINRWKSSEKNYLDTKTGLIDELGILKQENIVPYLRNAYERANDTASLQQAILRGLLRQQTPAAYATFKELILKEIPIFTNESSIYSLTRTMLDTMALSSTLFPDLLQMTALADYKAPVYGLLATLVDSGRIQPNVYESYIGQIAFEGRIVLQKAMIAEQANNADGEDEDDPVLRRNIRTYYVNDELNDYAVLLLPYRERNKNAARFFEKYESFKNPAEQIALARLYLRNNQPVKDSVLKSIAKQDKYRAKLWSALSSINRLDRFPKGEAKQEDMARSLLHGLQQYNTRYDTIALVSRQVTTYKFQKQAVYFFKYRQKDDTNWYIAIAGPQPENAATNSVDTRLAVLSGIPIKDDQPVLGQFYKVLKSVKYRKRAQYNDDFSDMAAIDYED